MIKSNQLLNLTLDSILVSLPLHSGAIKGRLAKRYAANSLDTDMAAELPSQHELIPNLAALDRLLMENSEQDRFPAIQRETEQLPYYLRGATAAVCQLEVARCDAVMALDKPMMGPHTRFVLPPEQVDPLSFAVDSYLFFTRRSFDAVIAYLRRCPVNISLPASMNDLQKGLRGSKYTVDSQLEKAILEFWDKTGSKIKGYRDQTSHKAVIVSNCVAFNSPTGRGLRMLLPDDAQEKRPSEIRYDPGVPAMAFIIDSLQKTIRFVNVIVERVIDLMSAGKPDARDFGVVGQAMRGAPLVISSKISGEPVPFPLSVSKAVSDAKGLGR